MNFQEIKLEYDVFFKELERVRENLKELESTKERFEKELDEYEKAVVVANSVAKKIQDSVKMSITSVVNYGLKDVFGSRYVMDVEFEEKYGRNKAKIVLTDGEKVFSPMLENGGGIVDLVSLCLRLSFWAMKKNLRNVMVADEPFKNLSEFAQDKVGEFLRLITRKLKIQIIMTTHFAPIASFGDRVFVVKLKNGVSNVEQK